ncbi:transposase, IS4-like family protein, partial [Leptospira interrogans serovar Bataviae str. HAI135]
RGKSSTGWFYGFKLHLIINDRGEILSFMVTPGNVDDRNYQSVFSHLLKIFTINFSEIEVTLANLFLKVFMKRGFNSLQN